MSSGQAAAECRQLIIDTYGSTLFDYSNWTEGRRLIYAVLALEIVGRAPLRHLLIKLRGAAYFGRVACPMAPCERRASDWDASELNELDIQRIIWLRPNARAPIREDKTGSSTGCEVQNA